MIPATLGRNALAGGPAKIGVMSIPRPSHRLIFATAVAVLLTIGAIGALMG